MNIEERIERLEETVNELTRAVGLLTELRKRSNGEGKKAEPEKNSKGKNRFVKQRDGD